jgi:hypothetical protein
MPRLRSFGAAYFAISCSLMLTGPAPAWSQTADDFSKAHFDGTFLILGGHILDASDIGVILQRTNEHFQNLSKSDRKDLSWDSDGVRYTEDSKRLKITWVLAPDFLHSMDGHPTNVFKGKLSIFEIQIVRNQPVKKNLLSKYGFEAAADYPSGYYELEKNGWKISIITDRDGDSEAVTLEHALSP